MTLEQLEIGCDYVPVVNNQPPFPHGSGSKLSHVDYLKRNLEGLRSERSALDGVAMPEDYYEAKDLKAGKSRLTRMIKETQRKITALEGMHK